MTKGGADKLTPAMRQYKAFKAKYPDAILFFRMGDFYELFWDDARIAAKVLGLALTSRSKGPEAIPMAGVPFHAVESYLAKMIRAGHRVAICEQIEDPATAKGLVQRDVVRLMTPGTLTDESMLGEREANYLAAVVAGPANPHPGAGVPHGLAWVELSTGQFFASRPSDQEALFDELCRIRPAECLLIDPPGPGDSPERRLGEAIAQLTGAAITRRPPWVFERHAAIGRLTEHFGTASLAGFGFEDDSGVELRAAGAVLDYLAETQKTALGHIRRLTPHRGSSFLQIDATTLRALEVLATMRDGSRAGSLLGVLDRAVTGMGSRRLRNWLTYPLRDAGQIEARQDAIAWLLDRADLLNRLRGLLDAICDVERVVSRLAVSRAGPRDLLGLARSLRQLPQIESLVRGDAQSVDPPPAWLTASADGLTNLDDLADYLERAISPDAPANLRDGGVIRAGFDAELDRLRDLAGGNRDWLARYQADLARSTGIASLRIGYNQVFGYYIEVTHAHADKVPPDFVRKQTLKNAERYITEPLKQYETQALSAESKADQLEARLFEQVRAAAAERTDSLQQVAAALGELDCIAALAAVARSGGYVRPALTDEPVLRIVDGRHPVLAETLADTFVPNDVSLSAGAGGSGDGSARMALITGPNMAGKSTYIRQVALLTLLAQTGSFVPAGEATIGVADRIFTRVGASDELARGQSTFMVEMTETANILNNATERSLVILDEVGRGTSTFDGLALAWAVTEYLSATVRCRCLFATHYHELTELADLLEGVANFNVAVREWGEQIVFLHRIVPGGTDKSYGIHVARLAGVPGEVIDRSRQILAELEGNFAREAHGTTLSASRPVPGPGARGGAGAGRGPVAGAETARPAGAQLSLFGPEPHPLLEDIRELDLDEVKPVDALRLLTEFQTRLKKGK